MARPHLDGFETMKHLLCFIDLNLSSVLLNHRLRVNGIGGWVYDNKKTLRWDLLLAWSKPRVKCGAGSGKKSSLSKLDDISYRLVIYVCLLSSVIHIAPSHPSLNVLPASLYVESLRWVPVAMSVKRYSCWKCLKQSAQTSSFICLLNTEFSYLVTGVNSFD